MKDSLFVEDVIITIYNNQTSDEQDLQNAVYKNKIGFRANHAKVGSQLAEVILQGNHLSGTDLLEAKLIALHYAKQYSK